MQMHVKTSRTFRVVEGTHFDELWDNPVPVHVHVVGWHMTCLVAFIPF